MKIIYLHQYFNTPDMPGSIRSFELASRLVRNGHEVFMLTLRQESYSQSKRSFSIEDGINVYWLPIYYSHQTGFIKRMIAFILFSWMALKQSLKIDADVIVASSTPLTIAIPAILAKKLKQIPMVFEVRDLWPHIPIAIGELKNKLLIVLAKRLETYTYKMSSKIITLSEGMQKNIIANHSLEEKTVVIPNFGIIINNSMSIDYDKKLDWLKNSPLVLYAGAIGRVNGLKYLVDMASAVYKIDENIKFLLAGWGKEKGAILNYADEMGVMNKNLFFMDPVAKKELPGLLSAATIVSSFTIPVDALKYNSANKFFDGLAAGKPVMINYGGWQKDLLEKTKAGFAVPPDNPLQAAEILHDFITNERKLAEYSASARKLARDQFSIESLYKKFENILLKSSKNFSC